MAPDDTLSPRELAFLGFYKGPGSGAQAAALAGYRGSRSTLKVRASKILAKPAAQAWLAARGSASSAPNVGAGACADGSEPAREPTAKETLEEIQRNRNALDSHRIRAAELLRREELAAKIATGDPFEALRGEINTILRAKRQREREERGR